MAHDDLTLKEIAAGLAPVFVILALLLVVSFGSHIEIVQTWIIGPHGLLLVFWLAAILGGLKALASREAKKRDEGSG